MFGQDEIELLRSRAHLLSVVVPKYVREWDISTGYISLGTTYVFVWHFLTRLCRSLEGEGSAIVLSCVTKLLELTDGQDTMVARCEAILPEIDGSFTDYKNSRLLAHIFERIEHPNCFTGETVVENEHALRKAHELIFAFQIIVPKEQPSFPTTSTIDTGLQ